MPVSQTRYSNVFVLLLTHAPGPPMYNSFYSDWNQFVLRSEGSWNEVLNDIFSFLD